MKCLIIDDDPVSRKHITLLCEKIDYIDIVAQFNNPTEALQIIDDENIDLIFLDIHMPEIDGISFLKSTKNPPKVIFTTGDETKAIDAFEVNATDYLLKPIAFPRFIQALEKVKASDINPTVVPTSEDGLGDLYIYEGGRHTRVSIKDISIVEAKGDHVTLRYGEKESLMTRSTMKRIELKLPESKFMRVHRSYIVNLNKIIDIEDNSILIQEELIPISRNAKTELMKKLNLL